MPEQRTDLAELTVVDDGVRIALPDMLAEVGARIDRLFSIVPEGDQPWVAETLAHALDVLIASAEPGPPGERVLSGEFARQFVRDGFAIRRAEIKREQAL